MPVMTQTLAGKATAISISVPIAPTRPPGWARWPAATATACAIMGLYLFMAGQSTLWDRDEGYFARYTMEMIQSGNYLYPTYNHPTAAPLTPDTLGDKPPLTFWLMSIPVRLLGPSELAFRLIGPLGHLAVCLLLYALGRRVFNAQAGFLAMLMYGLSPLACIISTAAVTDNVMMPFNMGLMLLAAMALGGGQTPLTAGRASVLGGMGRLLIAAGCFAGGLLSKSVFGVLPMTAVAGMAAVNWMSGRRARIGLKHLVFFSAAALLGGLIYLAWFIPANQATGGLLYQIQVGKTVVGRAAGAMQGHGGKGSGYFMSLPYYLPVVLLGFFPWTLFLPGAISAAIGGRLGGPRGRVLLVGWFVPVFLLMTVVATKLPHYVLFCWPAMALAAAAVVRADQLGQLNDRDRRWLRRGAWFFAPVVFAMAAVALVGPFVYPLGGLVPGGLAVGTIAAGMGAIALRQHFARRYQNSLLTLAGGLTAMMLAIVVLLVPVVERQKIPPEMAKIMQALPADTELAAYQYIEPSLVFYADRPITNITGQKALLEWANQNRPGAIVIPRETLDKIQKRVGLLNLEEISSRKGIDYSAGRWMDLVLLRRAGGTEARNPKLETRNKSE